MTMFSVMVNRDYNNKLLTPKKNKQTKMDRNLPITTHTRPFESTRVNFCFLRGLLIWLMAGKHKSIDWADFVCNKLKDAAKR